MKKGFKQTDIGLVPEEWEVKTIGEVCNIFGRIGFRGYTKADIVKSNHGAITISPSNIQNNKTNFNKCTYISWKKYEESPEIKIYNGDILLVKTGSTFGKTAYVDNLKEKATINPQIVVLKDIKVENKFLGYLMTFPIVQTQINSSIVGGAIPTLSQKQVEAFKIPLPPLPEQRAIAKVLSDVDALIGGLEAQIEKKRRIKQGTMQELLSAKADWEVRTLGEVGEVKMCRRIFNSETEETGDVPFFKIGTFGKEPDAYISSKLYNNYKRKFSFPKKGDILISAAGTIGRTIIYDGEDAYFQDSNIVWLDNDESLISNKLLYYIYQIVKYQTEGGTIQRLYNNIISSTTFSCPPKTEQTRIATILSDMDAEIEEIEEKVEKYRRLKVGLMQGLLSGRKRLLNIE